MNLNPGPNPFEARIPHPADRIKDVEHFSEGELKEMQGFISENLEKIDEVIDAREELLNVMKDNLKKINHTEGEGEE